MTVKGNNIARLITGVRWILGTFALGLQPLISMDNTLLGLSALPSLSIVLVFQLLAIGLEIFILLRLRHRFDHVVSAALLAFYLLIAWFNPIMGIRWRVPFAYRGTMITVTQPGEAPMVMDVDGHYRYRGVVFKKAYCVGSGNHEVSYRYEFKGVGRSAGGSVDEYALTLEYPGGKTETIDVPYRGGKLVALDRPEIRIVFDRKP